jgi:mono/diheme cytochrome c family protein
MNVEEQKIRPNPVDEAEPKEGWSPMPVMLFAALAILLYWGLTQLDDQGGGFNKMVYAPYLSSNQVAESWPVDEHQKKLLLGHRLFDANCAPCHQATGIGSPAQNAPPLAGSEWVNAQGPSRMINIVLNGLQGPVQVKGQQYGAGVMAPWRDVFNDEQLAAILSYIRENKSWGNNGSEVMTEQVAKIRKETANRGKSETSEELLKIPVNE